MRARCVARLQTQTAIGEDENDIYKRTRALVSPQLALKDLLTDAGPVPKRVINKLLRSYVILVARKCSSK